MVEVGIISGSGFYDMELGDKEVRKVNTEYGEVEVTVGKIKDKEVAFISRHGKGHKKLPNMINHKANIMAMKELEVKLIIGTTICGITNEKIELGKLLLFDDLFYLDNRLANGEVCTLYTKEGEKQRGHYLFGSPFCRKVIDALDKNREKVVYGHVNGPRFNSKAEISFIRQHADAISQTSGPEAILSGEVEIPYVLLGVGVDYANGVKEEPTPIEVLNENMEKSKEILREAIEKILSLDDEAGFEGFVYRFE